jgi:hypothetical protein
MLGIQFLYTAFTGEDVCQIVNAKGLLGSWMDGGHGLVRHVSLNVVPLCGDLILLENEFFLFCHCVFVVGE